MIPFSQAGNNHEIERMLELTERLNNLAFQAEMGWWDMARAEYRSNGYVSHLSRTISDKLCIGALPLCGEILSRLASVTGTSFDSDALAVSFLANQNTLYVGSKDLELEVEEEEGADDFSVQQGQQQLMGIAGVDVTVSMSTPAQDEDAPKKRKKRIATARAVTTGLKNKLVWMQHWSWNANEIMIRSAYDLAMAEVFDWAVNLVNGIGTNFATPLTAFYSLADNSMSNYDRPRISVSFGAENTLRLACVNEYSFAAVAPQGDTTGFHHIVVGDYIHVCRLECEGYDQYADRVYVVSDVDSDYIELTAPSDEQLPLVTSDVAEEFGEIFLLRKVRGVVTP